MDTSYIISKMNDFMFRLGQQIGTWLSPKLPRITEDWWEELVLRNLTPLQLEAVARKNIQEILVPAFKHSFYESQGARKRSFYAGNS